MVTATKNLSFRRTSRLLCAAEFNFVFDKAKRSSDKFFTVLYRPNGTDEPRLGFAIAKKKIAKATARNRLKRLSRESFRHNRGRLPGLDIVILANHRAAGAVKTELTTSLEQHWTNICRSASL